MQCREVHPLIAEYLDGALAEHERSRVAGHLDACADCRRELSEVERSFAALEQAAGRPAPDLWNAFQARLEPAAACREVRDRLPAYFDRAVEPGDRTRIAQHLGACPECAAEEGLLARSLEALESAPAPAPDLWGSLSRRMGAALSCAEVEGLLPAYVAGEVPDARSTPLRCHLDACGACASSAAVLERSLEALERAAAGSPSVDLWPAFVQRLEREEARRAAWLGWLRTPALRPALGAALLLAALVARGMLMPAGGPRPDQPGPAVVRNVVPPVKIWKDGARGVSRSTASQKVRPGRRLIVAAGTVKAVGTAGARERTRRSHARARPAGGRLLMASGGARGPAAAATAPHPDRLKWEPATIRIARNDLPEAAPREVVAPLPPAEEKKVLAQVVPCLEMLAGMEEAKANPLGKEPDAQ